MANDYFQFQQFTVRQDRCAMKVGTDGTLLGAWARVPSPPRPIPEELDKLNSLQGRKEVSILDIGTGTSLIALMMAQRFPQAQVTGIDIDPLAVRQACENVAASPFADRITIVEGDVRQAHTNLPLKGMQAPSNLPPKGRLPLEGLGEVSPFDAIVCNPPYFDSSNKSLPFGGRLEGACLPFGGRLEGACPDAQRTLARHTSSLSYRQLMASAWQLLSDDGELSVVIPFDCRTRMETEATLAGFCMVRTCAVRTTHTKPPRRFLLAFQKHPRPLQTEELVIGSEACNELTKDFYLKK